MERLKNLLEKWQCENIDCKINHFKQYMEEVLAWNEKLNMTAITDEKEFVQKHFLDSVVIYPFEEMQKAKKIVDIGTGAGFPAVPLAILFPEKEFVAVDSLKKRLLAIDDMTSNIGIKNVKTLHMRAEDMGRSKEYREQYDLCVSRAVANLATLSEYCLPLVKVKGIFLAYKGEKAKQELEDAEKAIHLLGGKIELQKNGKMSIDEEIDNKNTTAETIKTNETNEINKTIGLNHKIIIISKITNTPKTYPRKAGTPLKKPISHWV